MTVVWVCHGCDKPGPTPPILQLGPFAGGVPLTTALPFGAEVCAQGSLVDRSYNNTQLTGMWQEDLCCLCAAFTDLVHFS